MAKAAASLLLLAALATTGASPPHPPRLLSGWAVDRAASRLSFTLTEDGQPVQGVFKRWTAKVAFDAADPKSAHLVLNIDAASLVTGVPARDVALIGPAGLGAARAPRLVFTSRAVMVAPGGGYQALGELRARDGAHPTTFPFKLVHVDGAEQIDGEMALPLGLLAPPGQPKPTAAVLAVRLAARRP